MLIIETTLTTDNRTAYKFDNRGTSYTVIENGSSFEIWSERKSLVRSSTVRVMTRKEMKTGPKILTQLLDFIDCDAVAA